MRLATENVRTLTYFWFRTLFVGRICSNLSAGVQFED